MGGGKGMKKKAYAFKRFISYRVRLVLLCIQADGRQQMDTFRTTPIKQTLWQQRRQSKACIRFAAARSTKTEWFIYAGHIKSCASVWGTILLLLATQVKRKCNLGSNSSLKNSTDVRCCRCCYTVAYRSDVERACGTNSLTEATRCHARWRQQDCDSQSICGSIYTFIDYWGGKKVYLKDEM